MLKVLVVIPAYNESESIFPVVKNLTKECPDLDYIVINDGSTDNTATICREHHFPLLDQAVNLGLAGAVSTGMKYAYQNDYDAVIQFDSDGQHKPEYLNDLVNKLAEGYDIVCGSRFLDKPKPKSARMLGSQLISWAIKLTTRVTIKDPTSGLRIYGRQIIKQFVTQLNITPEPDTISYMIKLGAQVTEIPVEMDERIGGQSYLTLFVSIKYMLRMAVSILLIQLFRGGTHFKNVKLTDKHNDTNLKDQKIVKSVEWNK